MTQPFAQPPSGRTEETIDELLNSLNRATSKLRSVDKSSAKQGGADASVFVKKLLKLLDEVYELLTNNSFIHSTNKLKGKIMQTLLQAATLQNPRIHIKVVDLGILVMKFNDIAFSDIFKILAKSFLLGFLPPKIDTSFHFLQSWA